MSQFLVNISGLSSDTTETEHNVQLSNAIQTILKDLDGYASTEQEHYTQHSAAINTIKKDLDGYAVLPPSASASDGYVAFFTSATGIAGDNDLYWDRANNSLRLGGLLQFSGTDNTFPAIKRVGQDIHFRKADGSAYTSIACANIDAYGTEIQFGVDDTSDVTLDTGGGDIVFNKSPVVGTIELPTDGGAISLIDMPVSATPTGGDEMSYAFAVDSNTIFTAYAEADGSGGIQAPSLIMGSARIQGTKGADVASADEITLGSGNYFDITGTTQIDHITKTNWQAGSIVTLQFDGSVTLVHNSASPTGTEASILLSGAGNFSATADDTLTLVYDGVTWREIARTVI